jgi:hypothetical protein
MELGHAFDVPVAIIPVFATTSIAHQKSLTFLHTAPPKVLQHWWGAVYSGGGVSQSKEPVSQSTKSETWWYQPLSASDSSDLPSMGPSADSKFGHFIGIITRKSKGIGGKGKELIHDVLWEFSSLGGSNVLYTYLLQDN